MNLSILYRGPLASCNYDCHYCPFAKRRESLAEREADRRALARFVNWITLNQQHYFSIFFTPWGEALNRRRYQQALIKLTGLDNVNKAAIQTNLSCSLDWLADADKSKLALWISYHPGEVARAQLLKKLRRLDEQRVRYSLGIVGKKEFFDEIEAVRRQLPAQIYFWINAYKDEANYYSETEVAQLQAIDPLFKINTVDHISLGRSCRAGESVISVDGAGNMRRCHFISEIIGNIYQPDFTEALMARSCTNQRCGCHIGYVHMNDLGLYQLFGAGVLERVPENINKINF